MTRGLHDLIWTLSWLKINSEFLYPNLRRDASLWHGPLVTLFLCGHAHVTSRQRQHILCGHVSGRKEKRHEPKDNSYWSTTVQHSRLLKKHSHWLFRSNMVHASFNDVKPSFNNLKAGKRGSYRYVWIKHGDAHVLHLNIALRSFLKDDSRLLSFVLTEQRRTKWSSRIQRLYKLLNQTSSFEFLWQYSFTNLN